MVTQMIDFVISYLGWIILLAVILFIIWLGIRIVRPLEKAIIERFGKFRKVADQGLHLIIPIVDQMYRVNLTERMMDVQPQEVITQDNLNATVDLMVYYKVRRDDEQVKKSIYNVDLFEEQIVSLAQTTARNVIGTMQFKDVNSKRDHINNELAITLDKESDSWGVQIVRVEMKEITPPEDVQDTMNKVLKAENEKIAAVDYATAKETQADGERRAMVKTADGKKQALILEATGQAEAIKKVNMAYQTYFKGQAEVYKKLDTIVQSLQHGTKYVIDPNTNIVNVIAESMAGVTPLPINNPKTKTAGKKTTSKNIRTM